MDRVLVVTFREPDKVFEARDALKDLDGEDLLTLYAYAIITKTPEGKVVVNEEKDRLGLKTVAGTSLGSLIGLLGGPVGFGIGAVAGFLTGLIADLDNAGVSTEFVDDVSRELTAGKFALVAEVDEDWTSWLDLRMTELGGVVYRYVPSDVKRSSHEAEIAAMKANIAMLKAEHQESTADRKARLYEKINQLDTKIQQHLENEKKRRNEAECRAKAKAEMLKAKTLKDEPAETHI